MIYSVARVENSNRWSVYSDLILDDMRDSIAIQAMRDNVHTGGAELIEIIYITRDPEGVWRSALAENATHVKVTLEQEAS